MFISTICVCLAPSLESLEILYIYLSRAIYLHEIEYIMQSLPMTPRNIYVCDQIYVALQRENDRNSNIIQNWIVEQDLVQIFPAMASDASQGPCDLSNVLQMCKMVHAARQANRGKQLIVLPGPVQIGRASCRERVCQYV